MEFELRRMDCGFESHDVCVIRATEHELKYIRHAVDFAIKNNHDIYSPGIGSNSLGIIKIDRNGEEVI
jgi:hypothetical protein